jgi:hypothetical protein
MPGLKIDGAILESPVESLKMPLGDGNLEQLGAIFPLSHNNWQPKMSISVRFTIKAWQSLKVFSNNCVSGFSNNTNSELHNLKPWLQALEKPRLVVFFLIKIFGCDGKRLMELSEELLSIIKMFLVTLSLDSNKIDLMHLDK